ncbi:hypothetical protein, partial [Phocaeicola vulgatus]|uniref:hypothetical protein n=1 Tax=Phocaeicola vulgatus TaxID=821 RepID=UPI001C870645
PEEKDTHIIIFARAYKDGKRKEPIRKQQTENKKREKTEGKLANLQNLQHFHTHTRARTL